MKQNVPDRMMQAVIFPEIKTASGFSISEVAALVPQMMLPEPIKSKY